MARRLPWSAGLQRSRAQWALQRRAVVGRDAPSPSPERRPTGKCHIRTRPSFPCLVIYCVPRAPCTIEYPSSLVTHPRSPGAGLPHRPIPRLLCSLIEEYPRRGVHRKSAFAGQNFGEAACAGETQGRGRAWQLWQHGQVWGAVGSQTRIFTLCAMLPSRLCGPARI